MGSNKKSDIYAEEVTIAASTKLERTDCNPVTNPNSPKCGDKIRIGTTDDHYNTIIEICMQININSVEEGKSVVRVGAETGDHYPSVAIRGDSDNDGYFDIIFRVSETNEEGTPTVFGTNPIKQHNV